MNRPIFGYDIITPRGELPNGLNPSRFLKIYEQVKWDYRRILYYNSRDVNPVYLAGHFDHKVEKKSVYDIQKDRKRGVHQVWYYVVEPFGNFRSFLGIFDSSREDDAFSLHVSDVAREEMIYGHGRLLINYTIDGGIDVNCSTITRLYELIKSLNIPFNKVYFLMNDIKFKDNLKKVSGGANFENVYHFNLALMQKSNEVYNTLLGEGHYFFWRDKQEFVSKITRIDDFEKGYKKKTKKFLMLNRNWKMHRLELIKTLRDNNFLEDSLVSWDKNMRSDSECNSFVQKHNDQNLINLMSSKSSILDYPDIASVHGYGFESKQIYLDTFFHIVGETIYYQDDCPSGYVSEKTFKPMAHFQPFIFAGPSRVLQHLKDIGFKTFHPFIDETYDTIDDDNLRMREIEKQIIKIGNMSRDEMIKFTEDVKEILYHNYRTLFNYGSNQIQNQYRDGVIEFLNK